MKNCKPFTLLASVLMSVMLLTGCGSTDTSSSVSSSAVQDGYDVDLTQLSSSMVYGQVYDMINNADSYVGKSVKMNGKFSYYKDEQTGKEYFAVLIADAAACCSQGIEFVLKDSKIYPDDYPPVDSEITVTGSFDWYKENYGTYCQLLDAEITDIGDIPQS
ncbi:MAG TPA: hypothetical protein DCZ71_05110 [Ruminococcus sp.]|nr:hypothetical protein [Ruminococcus sp.]